MEKTFKKISLESKNEIDEGAAFYANVKTLEFEPEEYITDIPPCVKKGEWFFLKFLGIIPLIPLKAWNDLYIYNDYGLLFDTPTSSIDEYFSYAQNTSAHTLKGIKMYRKARVVGTTHNNKECRYRYFDSNEKAMKYFNYTKKKCEEYNNKLD